jgi:hypothetical protein
MCVEIILTEVEWLLFLILILIPEEPQSKFNYSCKHNTESNIKQSVWHKFLIFKATCFVPEIDKLEAKNTVVYEMTI